MARVKFAASKPKRPLSPHLQIYKPLINMVVSILHRLTGIALYIGTLMMCWWLVAAATGPRYYDFVNELMITIPGQLILFGYTWALVHHLLGGIRHLIWDTGRGFAIRTVNLMSGLTIIGSILTTLAIWAAALGYLKGVM